MNKYKKYFFFLCLSSLSTSHLSAKDFNHNQKENLGQASILNNETNSSKKTIYLTFDDGPASGTKQVLSVLKEEGVKATMFYIGNNVATHEKLFQKALAQPNVLVANHTYYHAHGHYAKFYSNAFGVLDDIDQAQLEIGGAKYLRLAGRNVWRMPELSKNDNALSSSRSKVEDEAYNLLSSAGYQIYGWDIEWEFSHTTGYAKWGGVSMYNKVERAYENNRTNIAGKIVLLSHDRMFRNSLGKKRLRMFIGLLKANGWTIDTIDSYSASTPKVIVRNTQQSKDKTKLVSIPKKMLKASTVKIKKVKRKNPLEIFDIVKEKIANSINVA